MLKGLGNWLRKVSRSRMLRRIDRLMGLSDMKLGRKTRKYFKKLRRSLNMTNSLLKVNEAVGNTAQNDDIIIGIMLAWAFLSMIILRIDSEIVMKVSVSIGILLIIGVFSTPLFILLMLFIGHKLPSEYLWPVRYKSHLAYTGAIGKVMSRIWKNSNDSIVWSSNNNKFVDSCFDSFNQMAYLLNMDMDYLDEPKYWSDEDYGRFMRIVLSYAFIYESADGKPDNEILSEFLNSDEVQSTAREVLNDVRKRKNRICGTDTGKNTKIEESSSTIVDEPVETDYDTIRSKDIQSRIAGKADEVRNILDNENRMESGLG